MRIVVTGASGRLGTYLVDQLIGDGHQVLAWSGTTRGSLNGVELIPVDVTQLQEVVRSLVKAEPDAVVHAAAISGAEAVLQDPGRGQATNVEATKEIAAWAVKHDRRILFTSTDLVFDGTRSWYSEEDEAVPILQYGWTKRRAEEFVLAAPRGIVARLCLLFGPSLNEKPAFYDSALAALARGEPRSFFQDEFRTPLDYRTAAVIISRLIESETTGILHVGGRERISRFELMKRLATAKGISHELIIPSEQSEATSAEPRPRDVSLDTTRLAALYPDLIRPDIETALAHMSPGLRGRVLGEL